MDSTWIQKAPLQVRRKACKRQSGAWSKERRVIRHKEMEEGQLNSAKQLANHPRQFE